MAIINIKNITSAIIIQRWLLCCCVAVMLMVSIGGYTRLTDSGLSITEWKPIVGVIPPLTQEAWQQEFHKYQLTPEFLLINADMPLQAFKKIYLVEYMHRLIGRIVGVVFFIPMLYFAVSKQLNKKLGMQLAGILFLGGFQGFLGWYMVASGLINNPHVSHYRLSIHLVTAFILFSCILWLSLRQTPPVSQPYHNNDAVIITKARRWNLSIIIMLFIQIFSGGLVAGLNAGLVYNSFPKMDGMWIPDGLLSMSPILSNFFDNVIAVQWFHRWMAMIIAINIFAFFIYTVKYLKSYIILKKLSAYAVAFVCIQIVLGVLTLIHMVPLSLALLHQFNALCVLGASLLIRHRLILC